MAVQTGTPYSRLKRAGPSRMPGVCLIIEFFAEEFGSRRWD